VADAECITASYLLAHFSLENPKSRVVCELLDHATRSLVEKQTKQREARMQPPSKQKLKLTPKETDKSRESVRESYSTNQPPELVEKVSHVSKVTNTNDRPLHHVSKEIRYFESNAVETGSPPLELVAVLIRFVTGLYTMFVLQPLEYRRRASLVLMRRDYMWYSGYYGCFLRTAQMRDKAEVAPS